VKANFVVHGHSAHELREEADRMLLLFDPEAHWTISIQARPAAENVAGEVQFWEGEVDAYDHTDRRT
jgi:hypothetical protein